MNTKALRKQIVLDVLSASRVESQEQLLALLQRRGVKATQATVSRDLRELGYFKGPLGYALLPAGESGPLGGLRLGSALAEAVKLFLVTAVDAGSMVVLKTRPGNASPLAIAIDKAGLPGALGTIAGDDTIFLAAANVGKARAIARAARAMLAGT
ncbi:MAG: arginine repressor [Phycisphaerales bacterium]